MVTCTNWDNQCSPLNLVNGKDKSEIKNVVEFDPT